MTPPQFGRSAFAVNRWAIGDGGASPGAVAGMVDKDRRRAQVLAAIYKTKQHKAKLRKTLMKQDPHCVDCGRELQNSTPEVVDYACVMGMDHPVLCCLPCSRSDTRRKASRESNKVVVHS